MVKTSLIIVSAIPIFFAILIAASLLNQQEVPTTAVVPDDKITIEYTKHQLKLVSFGVTERAGSEFTEILSIKNDGEIRYNVVEEGFPQPEKKSKISEDELKKITAMIKETGFMEIPTEEFVIDDELLNIKNRQ